YNPRLLNLRPSSKNVIRSQSRSILFHVMKNYFFCCNDHKLAPFTLPENVAGCHITSQICNTYNKTGRSRLLYLACNL
ncbi:hypothetical protein, partial [Klebsiella oxytoca]|uniref:hypothetical protein n=1 Tax=Klebsiella oxytoca TaxID=571 RepID=UPI001CCDD387